MTERHKRAQLTCIGRLVFTVRRKNPHEHWVSVFRWIDGPIFTDWTVKFGGRLLMAGRPRPPVLGMHELSAVPVRSSVHPVVVGGGGDTVFDIPT